MIVSHYLDFRSVNQTSLNIYNGIREIIWKEFGKKDYEIYANLIIGLNTNSSQLLRIDVILREFGLLDENVSIWPPFIELTDPKYPRDPKNII